MTRPLVKLSRSDSADISQIRALRHRILRAPWNIPPEHEWDRCDQSDYSGLVMNGSIWHENHIIATGRIHQCEINLAQVRYMAIDDQHQRQGLGRLVLQALEQTARDWNISRIFLNARENAIPFYLSQGYHDVAPATTLFGTILHRRMEKSLV